MERRRKKKREKTNVFWSGRLRPGDIIKYRNRRGEVVDIPIPCMRHYQGCVPVIFPGNISWFPVPLDDLEIL